jgi:hypothetical protein
MALASCDRQISTKDNPPVADVSKQSTVAPTGTGYANVNVTHRRAVEEAQSPRRTLSGSTRLARRAGNQRWPGLARHSSRRGIIVTECGPRKSFAVTCKLSAAMNCLAWSHGFI